jgi:F-type H+-transporting ATPase subunit c
MKNRLKLAAAALLPTLISSVALAQESGGTVDKGVIAIAAGLAIGLAAFGGALGQAKTAVAALDGIARNPAAQGKIFTPMIIGLALIESLVIYAFVIAYFLQSKF